MNSGAKFFGAGVLAMLAGAGGMALWQGQSAPANPGDRAGVEKIVREYILSHPEIIPEAMENLEAQRATKVVADSRADIETAYGSAWEGNPTGDVTLVEFFDYSCGYCKISVADVARLLAEDKNLKVVYREMPVLGPDSVTAAKMSLVLSKRGKFGAFHHAIYGGGHPDDATLDAALKQNGLNPAEIRTAAESAEVKAELDKSARLQSALKLSGTPSWVVGNKLISGAVGYEQLKAAIDEARKAKASS